MICPLSLREVDHKELDAFFLDGRLKIEDLPPDCFTSPLESGNIEIPANRTRKNAL